MEEAERVREWIDWTGGSTSADPLGADRIEVRFRCGETSIVHGDEVCWSHNGKGADVVAYRRAAIIRLDQVRGK